MRLSLVILLVLPALAGPDQRNVDIPGTKSEFRIPVYKSKEAWAERREALRNQILAAAGLLPLPNRGRVKFESFGVVVRPGFTVETLRIETLDGYFVGANLYRPSGLKGKAPAVLMPHGHWKNGRVEDIETFSAPAMGAQFARLGYVAIAWDMVGYNDTTQTPHDFGSAAGERLWSFGPLGLQLWNSIRMVDFMASLPEVDASRIGATGASGGGTQTFLLAAVDDRIKVAVPVNMISATFQGGSVCENAPGLRIGTSNLEFGAMMAPRPMLMVSATGDWTKNTLEVEHPQIRAIYQLLGAADKLEAVRMDAKHNYNQESRAAAYKFFAKHLGGRDGVNQPELPHELKPKDLLISRPLPANALSYAGLFSKWQELAAGATKTLDEAGLRRRLQIVTGARAPESAELIKEEGMTFLSRAGRKDRIPVVWVEGKKSPAVLIVHPEGGEAARQSKEYSEAVRSGAPVLILDVFHTGAAKASRDKSAKHFLTFNRSDDANRVQDILTGISFIASRNMPIRLMGLEHAHVWTMLAAALSDRPVEIHGGAGTYSGSDSELEKILFIPGIQYAGGLKTVRRLARVD